MRPVNLIISAFGPYADKTVINFEKLNDFGIFLISGDTGSGKTTIFDAICYALYDKASGDMRDNSMLRSDYADENTKTFVELTFEHNEKLYTIRRNPSYQRPKKRGDGYTTETANAEFTCGEKIIETSAQKSTEKIEELLGITYDQFTKIAMIAQGEFRKVLTADTQERVEILRKVFGTEIYDEAKKELKIKENKAREDYKKIYSVIENKLMDVECPENLQETEQYKEIRDKENPFINDGEKDRKSVV